MIISKSSSVQAIGLILVVLHLAMVHKVSQAQSEDPPNKTIQAVENRLVISNIQTRDTKEISIPRYFNAIRKATANDGGETFEIQIQPELTTWTLFSQGKKRDLANATVEIELDGPILSSQPIVQSEADGSFILSAKQAVTTGSKLRYEPQPFKNTVGYWVDVHDRASWSLRVDRPGKFNVEILQGCGAGQGGSDVALHWVVDGKDVSSASIAFVVEETGHFQNFRWRHLGEIELKEKGEYQLEARSIRVAKNAVMDIRKIEMVRIP